MKKIATAVLVLVMLFALCGCNTSDMPFNGDITFHNISLTIPERFVRDTTESGEDFWIFENGGYKEYILLNRNDKTTDDVIGSFESYVAYMDENNIKSVRTTFMGQEATDTHYEMEGMDCHEMLFFYNDEFYSIALRGGSKESFDEILATVKVL